MVGLGGEGGVRGGMDMREEVMRSFSGKLIFWMLVLVSPFLSFLLLCLQVKADVGIIRRGHRDMRNAYNERVSLVENQSIASCMQDSLPLANFTLTDSHWTR